jgi:hypothetical protein
MGGGLHHQVCENSFLCCFVTNNWIDYMASGLAEVIKVYSPTDAQLNCLKNNFKIYIKMDIKTAPTCFGEITIIRVLTMRSC